jgi:hypothetical protein
MEMRNTPTVTPSALSEGWHPGFLIHISEEPTPPDWQMFKQSPTMWRWHFLVWEVPTLIDRQSPEHQSGLTSAKFSPKGKYQASKAYTWTRQLLGRDIPPGQSVNWDTLYPVPCRVKVERTPGKDFIKILDIEAWPEGQPFTVSMAEPLRLARAEAVAAPVPVIPPQGTPAPAAAGAQPWMTQPPPPPQPPAAGMQSWGTQHGAPAPQPVQPQATGQKGW